MLLFVLHQTHIHANCSDDKPYLLIADGELPLGFPIVLCKCLELLHRFCLKHLDCKFAVLLRVFMTRLEVIRSGHVE